MDDISHWLYLVILLTNMFFQFVEHQGFVKLCRIVPLVLLVSLICIYGNKNKSKITREEQVHDGWQCLLSQSEAVNIMVTVTTVLTTILYITVWSGPRKINMFSIDRGY